MKKKQNETTGEEILIKKTGKGDQMSETNEKRQ